MADAEKSRWHTVIEIAEVTALAIVAIATAWSGYQATQWGGRQTLLYGLASTDRFQADALNTLGGQQLVADSSVFTAWLVARRSGDEKLQNQLIARFTPDYRRAFDEWLKTDPLGDPSAPPGPGYMPGFANPNMKAASELSARASTTFAAGTDARDTANKYVRDTVLLATVLFCVAIGQRFTVRGVRIGAASIAMVVLIYTLSTFAVLPRA